MISMATHNAILKNVCSPFYINTHISTANHPRILNVVPTESLEIALLPDCQICKLSNINIYEYILIKTSKEIKTYKITNISAVKFPRVPNVVPH